MKRANFVKKIIFIITASLLASCGYVEDTPVKDSRILIVDDLKSSCKIDTDRIKKMFEENITDQLDCIQGQLDKFKYVKTDNKEILTEADIQRFVYKYFTKNPQDIIDGLSLLFKLNTLLLQDEPGQMKVTNIKPFFDMLKLVNRDAVEIINIVKILTDERDREKFLARRLELENIIIRFSTSIQAILETRQGRVQSINIEDLILDLTKNLKDFKLGRELLNSILFVKKLFLGGSRVYISTTEALRLFKQFPVFSMNIFDVFLLRKDVFQTQNEYYEHIANNLELLKANVYQHQNEELILTITDLDRIIDEFLNDNKALGDLFGSNAKETADKLKKVIRAFKRDLVGGDEIYFTYRDVEVSLAFINVGIRSIEKISKISNLVKDINDKDLTAKLEIKAEFLKTFSELSIKVKELIEGNQDIPAQLLLLRFIQALSTDTDYINIDPQLINSIFSIKVATVGGSREITTVGELIKALERAEEFAKLYFDLQYLAKDYFELSDKAKYLFFERQIAQLQTLLLADSEVENVLTIADINIIIDQFYNGDNDDPAQGEALKALVTNIKNNVIVTDKDYLNFHELKSTVDMAYLAFKFLVFSKYHTELKKKVDDGEEKMADAKVKYAIELEKINVELKKYLARDYAIKKDIKIHNLITELENSKAIFNFDLALIKSATIFKSLILGGNNETIAKNEFVYITTVADKISYSLFDLTFNKFGDIEPKKELYKFILLNLRNINSILPKYDSNKDFFKLKEALTFADELVSYINKNSDEPKDEEDLIKPSNFKRTIVDFSERILSPVARKDLSYPSPCQPNPKEKGKFICSQDDPANAPDIDLTINNVIFDKLISIVDEALQSLLFTEVTYDYFSNEMLDPKPVTIKFYPQNIPEYVLMGDQFIIKLKEAFSDVALNNKYFRDENNFAYYQRDIIRNKAGYSTLVLMRVLLPYVLTGYGDEGFSGDPTKFKGFAVNQLQDFLVGIKSVLEELGLWTSNFESFGQNILLLSDLFQSRSTGDLFINLNEASEFVELILSSATLGSKMIDVLKTKCDVTYTEEDKPKVNTKCVRANFFSTLFDDLNLKKYFPRLKIYNDSTSANEMVEYIKGVEGFARDVPSLDQPWEIRDFTLVIGAMLNIESTFLRFDTSYDNRLDFNELNKALVVYKGAIIMLAKLEGKNQKLARTVFFYMVKYMKAPAPLTVWALDKIFKAHFKKLKATRLNISALLFYLVNSQDEKLDEAKTPEDAKTVVAKKGASKTEANTLNELGNLVAPYSDYLATKTGEEVDHIMNNIQNIYNDTKDFVGF